MTNKRREEERRQLAIAAANRKRKKRILSLATSVTAVVIVVLSLTHFLPITGGKGFTQPTHLNWGSFTQISNSNFGNETNIYYVSWIGCPIGAADSWAFYVSLSNVGNISKYVQPHYSDPNDSAPNTPGLIFSDFQLTDVVFHSYYVYNEFMNETTNGIKFNQTSALNVGISELSGLLPSSIYKIEYNAIENIPTSGGPGDGSSPTGLYLDHVNTNIIITGSKGAWVLNGPLYNPTTLAGMNSSELLFTAYSNSAITNGAQQVTSTINSAG